MRIKFWIAKQSRDLYSILYFVIIAVYSVLARPVSRIFIEQRLTAQSDGIYCFRNITASRGSQKPHSGVSGCLRALNYNIV